MVAMTSAVVTVERTLPADPSAVFEVLADPQLHRVIDGSGTLRGVVVGPARLSRGAEFGMSMKAGLPYRVTNRVVEFEEGRLIAWRHFGGHRWRYTLTPVEGGTLVREEWDPTRLPRITQLGLRLAGFPGRNRKGMEATLVRLGEHFSAVPPA